MKLLLIFLVVAVTMSAAQFGGQFPVFNNRKNGMFGHVELTDFNLKQPGHSGGNLGVKYMNYPSRMGGSLNYGQQSLGDQGMSRSVGAETSYMFKNNNPQSKSTFEVFGGGSKDFMKAGNSPIMPHAGVRWRF